ncbi:hypothetical protein Tco_0527673 [Tanacetum coccineum]
MNFGLCKTQQFVIPKRFQWVFDEELEAPEEAPPSPDYVPGPKHPPLPMIMSPQAEDTEAFKTDESASTLPTSPYHIILFSETKPRTSQMSIRPHTPPSPSTEACIAEFAVALPSSSLPPSVSPPPENIKSLTDNIEASI